MVYRYYALFVPAEEGGYSIAFPDLRGAYSCGDDFDKGMWMAQDCLSLVLEVALDDGEEIPPASSKEEVEKRVVEDPFYAEDLEPGWFVVPVEVEVFDKEHREEETKKRMFGKHYAFYGLFVPKKDEEDEWVEVSYPDLGMDEGWAENVEESKETAKRELAFWLRFRLTKGIEIPAPSPKEEIERLAKEKNGYVELVEVDV